ncbi:MAG: SRPBCC family protein [Acidimicrobiia bacterium]
MTDVIETAASTPERLEVSTVIDRPQPAVWEAFTNAEALATWWSQEATVDPVVGGEIIARWPSLEWTMRGRYTELEPHDVVAFTWSWDHEPDTPERQVRIVLSPDAAGTRLTLTHGDYSPTDAEERSGHLEGWKNFLPSLATDGGL